MLAHISANSSHKDDREQKQEEFYDVLQTVVDKEVKKNKQ